MSSPSSGFQRGPFELRFVGSARTLFRLTVRGVFLSAVTLGIKFAHFEREFWSYLFSNMTFINIPIKYRPNVEKERLYHASCVAVLLLAFANIVYMIRAPFEYALYSAGAFMGLLVLLFPFYVWMFLQSKLECLSWNGWNFRLKPLAGHFAMRFYTGFLLTVLTGGLYLPLWWNNMYKVFIAALRIGPFKTHYAGRDQDILRMAVRGYPLLWLTLGLWQFWLAASVLQYNFRQTWVGHPKLGAVRGSCNLSGNDLFGVFVVYFFLVPLSAGLLLPVIMKKNVTFFCEKMRMRGYLRLAEDNKAPAEASPSAQPSSLHAQADSALRAG